MTQVIGMTGFITGNQYVSETAGVFIVGTGPGTEQARADYAGDGDPLPRVLLMQLTTPEEDGVRVRLGYFTYLAAGSSSPTTLTNVTSDVLDLTGRCCLGDTCIYTTHGGCGIAGGTFIGCSPCTSCPPPTLPCPTDIAPGDGDGEVNVDDLLAVISAWGPCE